MSIGTSPFTANTLSPLTEAFVTFHISETDKTRKAAPTEQKQEKPSVASVDRPVSTPELSIVSKTVGTAKRILVVKNAHRDDIHGMISVGVDNFVTGSKDGSLKLWSTAGKLVRDVWNPKVINYTGWITALAPFGPDLWMSGTRDGYIDLWQNSGTHSKNLSGATPSTPGIKCKLRNVERINCLVQDIAAERTGQYYVGVPTGFSLHHVNQANQLDQCRTSQNDWVYCIRPLAERKVMVVTGPNLDMYTYDPKTDVWLAEELLAETYTRPAKNQVRPFISDVTFLAGKSNLCALSVFGGAVVVLDISTKTPLRMYKEHEKRVWQVVNIRPNIFASSSDDRTIKIWDLRLNRSALTAKDHIGRVSSLLCLSDNLMVSGSCPDDLKSSQERARLEFWDIRML
jgi:WD40 repeat protein